jgi:hypothetical protein
MADLSDEILALIDANTSSHPDGDTSRSKYRSNADMGNRPKKLGKRRKRSGKR